jgi:hypothetical protein
MSIWRSPRSNNWSIWFCNLWGHILPDYTLTFLESYEDFASFGCCFAQFQCVFANLWAFQGCPSFKHSFHDTNLILKFLRSVLMVWFVGYNMLRIIQALEEVRSTMCSSKCSIIFTYRCWWTGTPFFPSSKVWYSIRVHQVSFYRFRFSLVALHLQKFVTNVNNVVAVSVPWGFEFLQLYQDI